MAVSNKKESIHRVKVIHFKHLFFLTISTAILTTIIISNNFTFFLLDNNWLWFSITIFYCNNFFDWTPPRLTMGVRAFLMILAGHIM